MTHIKFEIGGDGVTPATFFRALQDLDLGGDLSFEPDAATPIPEASEEVCGCGLPISECDSIFKEESFVPTPEGLAYLSGLAAEADAIVDESVSEEREERRDAIAVLGVAVGALADATSILARLVEDEYGVQN